MLREKTRAVWRRNMVFSSGNQRRVELWEESRSAFQLAGRAPLHIENAGLLQLLRRTWRFCAILGRRPLETGLRRFLRAYWGS